MKIKEGCQCSTSDFWYDLIRGGYLKPEDMLENPDDIDRVKSSIKVLLEFKSACESQIDGFLI
jgi:hypothetical protein